MIEEPESLLDALRRFRDATPGTGTPADFGALANLVHTSALESGGPDSLILIGKMALSITKGDAEAMLLNAKSVWYALPQIIEAFELLAEIPSPAAEDWRKRIDTLLSKVSNGR